MTLERIRGLELPSYVYWVALALAWVASTALLVWLHRGLTFAVDEYDFWETVGNGSLHDFLVPQNGHLVVLPFLAFKLFLSSFGPNLLPFTLLESALLTVLSAGIYVYSRSRVGPLLALVPAVLPLFLGSAWPVVMPPMIGLLWVFALAAGLWALLLTDRDTVRTDVAACALLCVALASFSLGLVFVAACTVSILFSSRRWRRLYVVVIPGLAWAGWHVWALKYGTLGAHLPYLLLTPAYAIDSIAAGTVALFGRTLPLSPATSLYLDGFAVDRLVYTLGLAMAVAVVCFALVKRIGPRRLNRPSLWIVLAIPLVWWATEVLVLEPFRTPDANRYYLAEVVILLLVLVELGRDLRVTVVSACVVFALGGVALASNVYTFRVGRSALVALNQEARADMAMIDLEGRKGDQTFVPSSESLTPQTPFMFLTVGPHLDVEEKYGSPADSLRQVAAAPAPTREAADIIAGRLLLLQLEPAAPPAGVRCRTYTAAPGADVVVPVPRGGARFHSRGPRELSLGRFSDGFPVALGELPRSSWMALSIPTDSAGRSWRASAAGPAPLTVCPL